MKKNNRLLSRLLIAGVLMLVFGGARAAAEELLFLSTQLAPVAEAHKMRTLVLKDFPGEVNFQPYDDRAVFKKLASDNPQNQASLVGGTHGDLMPLYQAGVLKKLTLPDLESTFQPSLNALGRLDGKNLYYAPWMQATYIMAARKEALAHLPPGADLNQLTYAQLTQWAQRINKATGGKKMGFPAGTSGLMHRFLQGYLYPSYTGHMVRSFRSKAAEAMWNDFSGLWETVNPQSLAWNAMAEPLLSGEAWLAWDHTARLIPALEKQPDQFVTFPVPAAGKGRAFMVVLVGLAIPAKATQSGQAMELIRYLSRPQTQLNMLMNLGFFPVLGNIEGGQLSPGTRLAQKATQGQAGSPDALPALLPVGLGEHSGEFNSVYSRTFSQIIIRGRKPGQILNLQADHLNRILTQAKAPCWAPDPPSKGPCQAQ